MTDPHRLTAQTPTAKKNPKRVLKVLLGADDSALEEQVLRTIDLDSIGESCPEVGLVEFLEELRSTIPDELRSD